MPMYLNSAVLSSCQDMQYTLQLRGGVSLATAAQYATPGVGEPAVRLLLFAILVSLPSTGRRGATQAMRRRL